MEYEAEPVGFIFDPTDLEIITYYLQKMAAGEDLPCRFIHRLDVYESEPWNLLPADEFKLGVSRNEGFFFTPRHSTSTSSSSTKSSGSRPHTRRIVRGGSGGFWHGNGHKTLIRRRLGGDVLGRKTSLQFKTCEGIPTDWLMQEYLLVRDGGRCFESVALCKIYKKLNSSQRDDDLEIEEGQPPRKKPRLSRHQEPGDDSRTAVAVPIWSSSDDFNSCQVVPYVGDNGLEGTAAACSPATTTITGQMESVDCSQNEMFTLAELTGEEDSIYTTQVSGDYFCVDDYLCLDAYCD